MLNTVTTERVRAVAALPVGGVLCKRSLSTISYLGWDFLPTESRERWAALVGYLQDNAGVDPGG